MAVLVALHRILTACAVVLGVASGLVVPIAAEASSVSHSGAAVADAIAGTPASPGPHKVSGTLTRNTTWSPAKASAYLIQSDVTVAAGVTLTVAPGTVIKAASLADPNVPGSLTVEGTLKAVGTAASPVVFTSVNDNTVGGTTGTGSPAAGDWDGIWIDNGSANIQHATISYASEAVGGGSGSGSVVVEDTQVSSVDTGLSDDQPVGPGSEPLFGTFTAKDDSVTSSGTGIDVTSADATVTGNVITSGSGAAQPGLVVIAGSDTSTPPTPPTVEDNTVTAPADRAAYAVDSPALDFAQLASNSIGGPGPSSFMIAGTVSKSQTMPAESYPWLVTPIPQAYGPPSPYIDIPAGVTLTVAPGTVIKAASLADPNVPGSLTVEGTLKAVGTAASPVVFTSVNDNTVGGTTGSGSPAPGDWDGIDVDEGSANVQYADIRYAATALDFDANATSNDDAHHDWFDDNSTAIDGSATWSTLTAGWGCFYLPTMDVSGNEYGPSHSTSPLVSSSDYDTIQADLLIPGSGQYPDGWVDDLATGSSDYVNWGYLPCVNPEDLSESCGIVATPLNFSGDPVLPTDCDSSDDVQRHAERAASAAQSGQRSRLGR
jgi:hypothetical protein